MLRVIVADDEPVIRNGIVHLIESSGLDLKVAGTAEDGREAVELVQKLDPEIIIMDINMPQLNGLEAIGEIRKSSPGLPDSDRIRLQRFCLRPAGD